MKKTMAFAMAMIAMMPLCGCGDPDYKTPAQIGQMDNVIVVEALKTRDGNKLKSVLAPDLRKQQGIDGEIRDFVSFIDGNIVSHDDIGLVSSREGKYDEEGPVIKIYDGSTENIITDTGRTYELRYQMYYVNRQHADYEGITILGLYDSEIYEQDLDE